VATLTIDIEKNIPQALTINSDGVAVIIGNCNYAAFNRDVPNVDYAVRDAAVMKEYLTNTLGYRIGNIIYETDAGTGFFRSVFGTVEKPHGRLADFVKAGKSDVFIYYSGHGAPDVNEKRGYFVPIDCSPGDVDVNGYPLDMLYNNLALLKARSTTVVIDACFSGGSDRGMIIEYASPVGIRITNPAAYMTNGIVFTSSSSDQISSWYPEKKHGLFTYFFLKGFRGDADDNNDGSISAGELKAYVSDSTEGVPYWARRLHDGRTQQPGFFGDEKLVIRGKVKE